MKDPFYFACVHCGKWTVEETEPRWCDYCGSRGEGFRRFSTRDAADAYAEDTIYERQVVDVSEGFR